MNINNVIDSIVTISNNMFILLILLFLYATTNYEIDKKITIRSVLLGLVIGLVAIFMMSNPFVYGEGIVFDPRSILFSISGVFFGPLPTIVGGILAIAFRIYMGGVGVYVGSFTVVISVSIGFLWKYLVRKVNFKTIFLEYYLLGLMIHILVFLSFLTLPNNQDVAASLAVPFIGIFPVVTMFIGVVMQQQKERIVMVKLNKAQHLLLQSSIDATETIEIYSIDKNYNYLTFNALHQVQMQKYYNKSIKVGDNFLEVIDNPSIKNRLKLSCDIALGGEKLKTVVKLFPDKDKFIEEYFMPIERGKEIIGLTIFTKDITEQKQHETSITIMNYYDAMTNIYNRRFFQEKIDELSLKEEMGVAIVMCDVNGLKLINDAFGHHIGDELLISVAQKLESSFKDLGFVCRIGGDEFVVVIPNLSNQEVVSIMEDVQQSIEKDKEQLITVSISYGVAIRNQGESLEQTIKNAEEEMYKHKLFELNSHRSEFIKTILNTLHEKNPREQAHSIRVSTICTEIGKQLGMKKSELNLLEAISSLHDIGKIAIDEAILNKPGKLTPEEWDVIKKHPEIGYRIISTAPEYYEIAEDILSHHEHFNGKGYPRGLKADEIPLRARIISIADAFDAMISRRTYREPMTKEAAINEIKRCSGTQFDPELVTIFESIMSDQNISIN